jgi:hypothetical protein
MTCASATRAGHAFWSAQRLAVFLARNSCCRRRRPEELIAHRHGAPRARPGAAEAEARRGIVPRLVGASDALCAEITGAVRAHAEAGISPVPIQSDTRRAAVLRHACHHRLRATRHRHPWARAVYRRARGRGADHPHAIRILSRARLRVIHQMRVSRTPYDPTRHGNLQRLLAEGG